MKSTVIIGIGNPLLGDDGLGVRAARLVLSRKCKNVVVKETSTGGLGILEEMLDFEKAILIDAMVTGKHPIGTIVKMTPDALSGTLHSSSPHDMNLATALEVGRKSTPERMPRDIVIIAVEARTVCEFSEDMSPELENALPIVVKMAIEEISL